MNITTDEVIKLRFLLGDTLSLNNLVNDEEDSEVGDFIVSDVKTPEDIYVDNSLNSEFKKFLEKCNLTENEMLVLSLRYGLDKKKIYSLDDIGKMLNVTKERVRQIEASALIKLRKSKMIEEFALYTDNPSKSLENIKEYRKMHYENPTYLTKKLKIDNDKS